MMIHSDWHLHSNASYDSTLGGAEIAEKSAEFGFEQIGITDHVNLNDQKFLVDLKASAAIVEELRARREGVVFGVELTAIEKPMFDYVAKHGTVEGYVPPVQAAPYAMELALSKEELMAVGVRYAIGAAHWRVDVPGGRYLEPELGACIREWHRQQMWLACDERVTILGHPWYHGKAIWYDDFSIIPRSYVDELAAALKENGKYVECNSHFFNSKTTAESFRRQYAEFLRELFERGVPVTYGSDSHNTYLSRHVGTDEYLRAVGFVDGEICALDERVLW